MAKTRTKIITSFVLIAAAVGVVYAWTSMPNAPRWERGYSQIAAGDSGQKVVEILGKPTEIKDCHSTRYSAPREIWEECAEEYWYIASMQEWGYVLDADGKVLTKWHSVSP
jgi:hypothetical protein